jgi:hypothetical protein
VSPPIANGAAHEALPELSALEIEQKGHVGSRARQRSRACQIRATLPESDTELSALEQMGHVSARALRRFRKKRQLPRKRQLPSKPDKEGKQVGRWTSAEHDAFLLGLERHGRAWSTVADMIPTRTETHVCGIF